MSFACGTLANPSAFALGNKAASISNGKQHTLPTKCHHTHLKLEQIEAIWDPKQSKQPSRLWGTASATKYGGEQRPECEAQTWSTGELWNIDSNIWKWGGHEVRRNAAAGSHDIHRHDQITRCVLAPPVGSKRSAVPRACISGVVSPDCCFLEAWGFDLGLRDRQANPVKLFRPVGKAEQFRALRSFDRDIPRMAEHHRTLNKTASAPGALSDTLHTMLATLRPEDIGGEAGEHGGADALDHKTAGKTHGSRSCNYWDSYDHTCKREAAKLACSIHSPAFREHKDAHPFVDEIELRPQAIYTRKYRVAEKNQPGTGHHALRGREGNSRRVPMGL